MDIAKLIRDRRTVHSYEAREVELNLLKEALELALFAPNHKLTYPYRFVHVKGPVREAIADEAKRLKLEKDSQLSVVKQEAVRKKFASEGSLIFFAQKLAEDEFTRKEDYASLACAIQNYSLFLWDHGIGTKWSSGGIIRSDKTYELLALDPEEFEIVGMIWAGYFQTAPKVPERKSLDEHFQSRSEI